MNFKIRNVITAKWMLFTILGDVIGAYLGAKAGEQFGFSLGVSIESFLQSVTGSFLSGYLPGMTAGFIYGSVIGFSIGFVQWLIVLRNQYAGAGIWVLLNAFGFALAICLNSGVIAYLTSIVSQPLLLYLIFTSICGPLTGFIIGLLNWSFFRHKHIKAIWWIVLNVIGWILINFVILLGVLLDVGMNPVVELAFNVIDSIVIAIFTGIAFYITFSGAVPETKSNVLV